MMATERGPAAAWPRERFSVNISWLFQELPLAARPAAAACHGFSAVELWWPFASPAPRPAQIDALVSAIDSAGVQVASLNLDSGDRSRGDRGIMCRPEHRERFTSHVEVVCELARRLECPCINALFGNVPLEGASSTHRQVAIENYARAAERLAEVGATMLVEPINPVDAPHYGIRTVGEALTVLEDVSAASGQDLGILLDVYHLSVTEDRPVSEVIRSAAGAVRHVQIADRPGRHEPGTGRIDFSAIFSALDGVGYTGLVGLEYTPTGTTTDSFRWLDDTDDLGEGPGAAR